MNNPTCSICKQPIREGEEQINLSAGGPQHDYASDCIAAAVRRCAEIAAEVRGATAYAQGGFVLGITINAIEEEFPEAFPK